MQRVNAYLHEQKQPPYVVNLDPAVTHLPFTANIDIRDTVDYQEVMKQYVIIQNHVASQQAKVADCSLWVPTRGAWVVWRAGRRMAGK